MKCILCGSKVFSGSEPMIPRCEEYTKDGILAFVLCYKRRICMINKFSLGGTRMAGYKHLHFYLNNFDSPVKYLYKMERIGFLI